MEFTVGGHTISFRAVLLLLVISATPLGNRVWALVGIPVEPPNPGLEKRLSALEAKFDTVVAKVDNVADDVSELSTRVTGFQVDFKKYQQTHP